MTTLAVLADIHGNLPALQAVMRDMAQFEVDHVIVAGDIINWGPFSAQCVEAIARAGWAVIRGNNEFYLLDYNTPREPEAWKDRTQWCMLEWLHEQLRGKWHAVIAAWPDMLGLRFPDGPPIRVIHGSGHSAWEGLYAIYPDEQNVTMLAGIEESFVIAAHTHLTMDHTVGRWRVFNPGSVGVPLEGKFGASYMLLRATGDSWCPTFRHVPGDITPIFREYERQRFVGRCGVIGQLVVEEFRTARMQITPFVHWRAAEQPTAPLSFDLLEQFTDEVRWAYTPLAYHVNR